MRDKIEARLDSVRWFANEALVKYQSSGVPAEGYADVLDAAIALDEEAANLLELIEHPDD